MPDDNPQAGQSALIIPDDVQASFSLLIDLIVHSESMNDEEKQYWIDILPSMTPEQVEKLRGILQNEKDQLAAIDAKYAVEIDRLGEARSMEEFTESRKERLMERKDMESKIRAEEEEKTEDILKKINEV